MVALYRTWANERHIIPYAGDPTQKWRSRISRPRALGNHNDSNFVASTSRASSATSLGDGPCRTYLANFGMVPQTHGRLVSPAGMTSGRSVCRRGWPGDQNGDAITINGTLSRTSTISPSKPQFPTLTYSSISYHGFRESIYSPSQVVLVRRGARHKLLLSGLATGQACQAEG